MICLTLHYSTQPNTHCSIEYLGNRNLQVQLMYIKRNSHYMCLHRFPMVYNLLNLLHILGTDLIVSFKNGHKKPLNQGITKGFLHKKKSTRTHTKQTSITPGEWKWRRRLWVPRHDWSSFLLLLWLRNLAPDTGLKKMQPKCRALILRNPAKKESARAKGKARNAKNDYQGPSSGEQRSALLLKIVLNALGKWEKEFKKRGVYAYVGVDINKH